jgi:protein-S-isoprenylcysteine O-methyltransferase Ste14
MLLPYVVCSILFLLFSFFVFRIVVKNDYHKKHKLSISSYLLEIVVFALHANMMYLFVPASWPDSTIIQLVLFYFILVAGIIILLIAWFGLGTATSFGLDKGGLKTTGIYKYTRNPQLVGYGLVLISIVVLYPSWYSVGWFIQYVLISYFMIQSEEEFLSLRYGKNFEDYCKKVPRILKIN